MKLIYGPCDAFAGETDEGIDYIGLHVVRTGELVFTVQPWGAGWEVFEQAAADAWLARSETPSGAIRAAVEVLTAG